MVSLALLAVVALATSLGGGTPDRDWLARRGRSGPQRLDSVDAVLHSHEVSEPDSTDSGRVVGTPAPLRMGYQAPVAACLTVENDISAPESGRCLASVLRVRPRSVTLPPHAPGRAPPLV